MINVVSWDWLWRCGLEGGENTPNTGSKNCGQFEPTGTCGTDAVERFVSATTHERGDMIAGRTKQNPINLAGWTSCLRAKRLLRAQHPRQANQLGLERVHSRGR